jgi:dCTP deaminase
MSLLSALELKELVEAGVIEGVREGAINAASIDLHLGCEFLKEGKPRPDDNYDLQFVDLSKRESPLMVSRMNDVFLRPREFCLASTVEIFNLPDDVSGMFILKSSMARAGLEHSQAGLADAGWNGSVLTLELTNLLRHHTLILKAGMPIGQIVLFRHTSVPPEFSYRNRGRYNGDRTVSGIKL